MKQEVDSINDKNITNQKPTEKSLGCSTVTFITQPSKAKTIDSFKVSEVVTPSASILTALVSLVLALKTIKKYSNDRKLQIEQAKSEKAKDKIEKFYGPINSLLEESRTIYAHFALQEKKILKEQNGYFRTLRFLTEPGNDDCSGLERLSKHDKELFKHIIDISNKVTTLIETESGHIDNPALHILLGRLAAHYRIIKSASEGKLTGQSEYLESIVFPLEINGAINSEICKLLKIIKSDAQETPSRPVKSKTINYYDQNYISYYSKTNDLDMSDIYKKVRRYVQNGANILDAGCGVGRDTQYFIKHGFKVTSFDASPRMVELCNEYPFAFCEEKSFLTIYYPPIFDLVWACASLLHLNAINFKKAILRLHRSLKPGAYLYFSLKKHIDPSKVDARDFYSYSTNEIDRILINFYKMEKVETWETDSNLTTSEVFVNYIYKKR